MAGVKAKASNVAISSTLGAAPRRVGVLTRGVARKLAYSKLNPVPKVIDNPLYVG